MSGTVTRGLMLRKPRQMGLTRWKPPPGLQRYTESVAGGLARIPDHKTSAKMGDLPSIKEIASFGSRPASVPVSGGNDGAHAQTGPDPHVDPECLSDMMAGYLTVYYYHNASEAIKKDATPGAQSSLDRNMEVNGNKLPGMSGGSRCMQFGRQLAEFEIQNWELIERALHNLSGERRVKELMSYFKATPAPASASVTVNE